MIEGKRNMERSKRDLFELKQRIFYNKVFTSTSSNNTTTVAQHREQSLYYKNLDFLADQIRKQEDEYHMYQSQFNSDLAKMWENNRNPAKKQDMRMALIYLIEQRLDSIYHQWKDTYNFRINYYLRNSYDNTNEQNTTSNLILATNKDRLTDKQLQLLNRGPTYITLCQMYVSSSSRSIHDIMEKQFAPLKQQLTNLFTKYQINPILKMEIQNKIQDQFTNHFANAIPSDLQQ